MKEVSTVIAEMSVVPVGTGSTSLSKYVAIASEALDQVDGLTTRITPMGTVMQAQGLGPVLEGVKTVHKALSKAGLKRLVTDLRIDDRRDKQASMDKKLESVERRHGSMRRDAKK